MKILVINPFGIGDVLFSTPLLRNLKKSFPQSYIAYLCNARNEAVLKNNSDIDRIFIFEKDDYRNLWERSRINCIKKILSFFNTIKNEKFDIAIDLSLSRQYSFFLWLSGIKKRIGYNYKNRGRLLNYKLPLLYGYHDKPITEYYLGLLRRFLNIKPDSFSLFLPVCETDKIWADNFLRQNGVKPGQRLLGIIPGGGASWGKDFTHRHWAPEEYSKFCKLIVDKLKLKVVLLGDKRDVPICNQVSNGLDEKMFITSCGRTNIGQFAALITRCALVVCNDGGPLHVAVAQGVKTVSIFGPVDERVYGPYPRSSEHVVVKKDLSCRPCYKRFKMTGCRNRKCLKLITAEEVMQKVEGLL